MPLIEGKSNAARSENIKRELAAGKPAKQAEAIGYSVQREAQKGRDRAALDANARLIQQVADSYKR